jgi:hypothetical protein
MRVLTRALLMLAVLVCVLAWLLLGLIGGGDGLVGGGARHLVRPRARPRRVHGEGAARRTRPV